MKPEPFPKRRENQTQLQHARDCTYLSLGYSSAPSMIDTPSLRFFVGKRSTEAHPSNQLLFGMPTHPTTTTEAGSITLTPGFHTLYSRPHLHINISDKEPTARAWAREARSGNRNKKQEQET